MRQGCVLIVIVSVIVTGCCSQLAVRAGEGFGELSRRLMGARRLTAEDGWIVFNAVIGGTDEGRWPDEDIWVIRADGTGLLRVTDNDAVDYDPQWSPDGKRIAFSSQQTYEPEYGWREDIWAVNADGSGLTRLTLDGHGSEPAWSPDGQRIAFVSDQDGENRLCVMNADGTGQRRLTDSQERESHPSWSPDGSRIAFTCERALCTMNADGGERVRLTDGTYSAWEAAWSPDGTWIAFQGTSVPKTGVFVVRPDGSGLRCVTEGLEHAEHPAWSPDGEEIAFTGGRPGGRNIYVVGRDGSGLRKLTKTRLLEDHDGPVWSPDGAWVAFPRRTTARGGDDVGIWAVRADGSGQTRLVRGSGDRHTQIAWKP